MNIERFHNEIAMRLGYERILKYKRISFEVEESDDPWVTLKFQDYPKTIRIKASETVTEMELIQMPVMQEDIKIIIDEVHQAYIQASTNPF